MINAEAIHTPLCRLLRSWANDAFSLAFTVKTPTIEQRMPRPASAIGATASDIASLVASPVATPTMLNAAAAPSAIVARIDP